MTASRYGKTKKGSGRVMSYQPSRPIRSSGNSVKPKVIDDSETRRRTQSGQPLIMRLMINDMVKLDIEGETRIMRVVKMGGNGQIFLCPHDAANVDKRNRDKEDPFQYTSKYASSLQKARGRRVTVSAIGDSPGSGVQALKHDRPDRGSRRRPALSVRIPRLHGGTRDRGRAQGTGAGTAGRHRLPSSVTPMA